MNMDILAAIGVTALFVMLLLSLPDERPSNGELAFILFRIVSFVAILIFLLFQ